MMPFYALLVVVEAEVVDDVQPMVVVEAEVVDDVQPTPGHLVAA